MMLPKGHRRRFPSWLLLAALAWGCQQSTGAAPAAAEPNAGTASADVPQQERPPAAENNVVDVRATDVHGHERRVLPDDSAKAVVFVFLLHDCPIANSYAPELRRLYERYAPRGVAFYPVQVDPDLAIDEAKRHAAEYNLPGAVLLDANHALVDLSRADKTPEAAVFSPRGKLLYRGRIDDLYVDFGQRRVRPRQHDLRNAIDAALAGRPAPHATGPVIGCDVPPSARGVPSP